MKQYLPGAATAKAVASALVVIAVYLIGVFPTDGSLFHDFAEMTGLQWLGLVVFTGGAYGITYAVPNKDRAAKRQADSVQPPNA